MKITRFRTEKRLRLPLQVVPPSVGVAEFSGHSQRIPSSQPCYPRPIHNRISAPRISCSALGGPSVSKFQSPLLLQISFVGRCASARPLTGAVSKAAALVTPHCALQQGCMGFKTMLAAHTLGLVNRRSPSFMPLVLVGRTSALSSAGFMLLCMLLCVCSSVSSSEHPGPVSNGANDCLSFVKSESARNFLRSRAMQPNGVFAFNCGRGQRPHSHRDARNVGLLPARSARPSVSNSPFAIFSPPPPPLRFSRLGSPSQPQHFVARLRARRTRRRPRH